MLWEAWLNQTSAAFGDIGITNTAYIVSFLFILGLTFITVIASKGHFFSTLAVFVASSMLFTVFGWISYWILLIIVLLVAGMYATTIRKGVGG